MTETARPSIGGPDEFVAFWTGFREGFQDIRIDVDHAVDEGDWTFVSCTATFTRDGKPMTLEGGCRCRVEDGRILECENYWDFTGLMQQMGALPANAFQRACEGKSLSIPRGSEE